MARLGLPITVNHWVRWICVIPPLHLRNLCLLRLNSRWVGDFRNQGGKTILYAGWSDSLVPALDTINYYDAVTDKMGGIDATRQFARLFVAPGLGHCRGGAGPNVFDTLNALDNWVKKARPRSVSSQ